MKKIYVIGIILLGCIQFAHAQVLVRCPNNTIARCVPQDESSLDTWTITPCDCNDPQNIYAQQNYCRRTITLCSNNPKIPPNITSFDFPYYGLDPLSMLKLKGPNLQPLVSYMEPTGELDPNLSADDQLLALLLEIDQTSKCISFDAWVPMGEEHTIKVFTETNETGNGWRYIPIPADDCSKVRSTCHTFQSNSFVNGIAKEPGYSFIKILNPFEGTLTDINIKNINITDPDIRLLKMVLVSPQDSQLVLNLRSINSSLPTINIGFDDLGEVLTQTTTTTSSSDVYQPEESFEVFRRATNPKGLWELRVSTTRFATFGSFNGWEAEFCIADDLCGPYEISPDRPQAVGDVFTSVTSRITIPEAGKVSSLKITNLNIGHDNSGDLKATLRSPQGTEVVIFDQQCEGNGGYNLEFSDEALLPLDCDIVFKSSAQPQGSFFKPYWRRSTRYVELDY